MRKDPISLGDTQKVLDMGRTTRRQVRDLEAAQEVKGKKVTEEIRDMTDTQGLEFVRRWDKATITGIVLTPVLISLCFTAT